MKFLIVVFFVSTTILLLNNCDSTEPKLEPDLKLELKDVTCTEAWLQLTTNNIQLPATINLLKNNTVTQTFSLSTQDSLLYIDSLLPNQNYSFQVSSIQNPISSNKVTATTLDTTSHNFTWQTFTFGERTSTLYDVAIIDENNIWAVGEIYMNDSLGNPDPSLYNLLKWNGTEWKPERIYFTNRLGQSFLAPMKSLFAFDKDDIWIGLDQLIHWDGSDYTEYELSDAIFQSWINKIWGTSSNDLYIVGNSGNIAHYGGPSVGWKKIESGTTTSLTDIYGDGENVFICGYEDFKPTVLLKYENNSIKKIIEETEFNYNPNYISGWVKGIWVKRNKLFSLTFYDLYKSNVNTKGEGSALWKGDINSWGSNAVRGNDVNDIFTAGYDGLVWHYNGLGWRRYEILADPTNLFFKISTKENIVVFAGEKYLNGIDRYGIITFGRR